MSKHNRRKAARRKQHNASAKERTREWKTKCLSRRDFQLAEMQRRELEGCNVKATPPRTELVLEQILDDAVYGNLITSNHVRMLGATLPHIWSSGCLDLLELVKHKLPLIDTEGTHHISELSGGNNV